MLHHRGTHFLGGTNVYQMESRWSRNLHGTRYQGNRRAAAYRCFSNCISHLAARSIRYVTHWIERFLSGSGGNENVFSLQVPFLMEETIHGLGDLLRLRHASWTRHAAG